MALKCNKCYFTFGRFQPPTIGHKENFDAVKRIAGSHEYRIYISQSVDLKGNNPLLPARKLYYMNKMFPTHKGHIYSGPRDPVAVLQDIMMAGFDEAVMLVGSDRVQAMQWIHKYNGNDKDFSFRTLDIISSGSRDADGDTFKVSGTKMRRAAFAGDYKEFKSGIPNTLTDTDCQSLMMEVAANLPANYK